MDEGFEMFALIHPSQFKGPGPFTVSHDPIVRAHYPRKKSETQDALAVVMGKAFIIDQRITTLQKGPEKSLVRRLFFLSMGKETVGFIFDELGYGDLFNAQQQIAFPHILLHPDTRHSVFPVTKTPNRAILHHHPQFRILLLQPMALLWRKRHPVIRRYLSFPNESYSEHSGLFSL